MELEDYVKVTLTKRGADYLNRFNEKKNLKKHAWIKHKLKVDYKAGETYNSVLSDILYIFSGDIGDGGEVPFTNLRKA